MCKTKSWQFLQQNLFKVWNVEELSLVYQSTIITASPFISMTMNLHVPQVAIGTADGIVRVYDLSDGKEFRCVHKVDVGKIMDKYRQQKEQALLSPTSQKNGKWNRNLWLNYLRFINTFNIFFKIARSLSVLHVCRNDVGFCILVHVPGNFHSTFIFAPFIQINRLGEFKTAN